MAGFRNRRFSIFDAMELAGVFEANPANVYARDPVSNEATYKGPVAFPRMFYHPEGLMEITVAAEMIATPFGPKFVGEQRQLITRTAKNEAEAKVLVAGGWHDHPALAIRTALAAAGQPVGEAPPANPADRIAELERQIASMQAARDNSAAQALALPELDE